MAVESSDHRYRVPSSVVTRPIADELILLNNATETYFSLDPVGAAMFNALVSGTSMTAAVEAICNTFQGAEPGQVEADLRSLIKKLEDKQLLELSRDQ